jgi:acetyltransferase-like isoleucine patch superfamily enzyme
LRQRFPQVTFRVGRVRVGPDVRIGPGSVIVGDEVDVGGGAVLGDRVDLRGSRISIGRNTEIGAESEMVAADHLELGDATVVGARAHVRCRVLRVGSGTYCGDGFRVGLGASMEPGSEVTIGSLCQIAPDVGINPTEPVRIGDRVGISSRVTIWTHGYHSGHGPGQGVPGRFAGVDIGDGVWLAFDVTVLPGVQVGDGTVVGVRSVVQRSLPGGVLAVGVPARVKRELVVVDLARAERVEAVDGLFSQWLDRLTFKGWPVSAGPGGRWRVTAPVGEREWVVWRPAGSVQVAVQSAAGAGPVVFDFSSMTVSGVLDVVGHDLRDLCRRRSWLFPYSVNSAPIVPERFGRLFDVA